MRKARWSVAAKDVKWVGLWVEWTGRKSAAVMVDRKESL